MAIELGFHKGREIFWIAEPLSVFQEKLLSMKLELGLELEEKGRTS
jgi:hypothetical protein